MASSPPHLVKAASEKQGAVFLDVRTDDEIKEVPLSSKPVQHVSCTLEDCTELMARAEELMPDKNGNVLLVDVKCATREYHRCTCLALLTISFCRQFK